LAGVVPMKFEPPNFGLKLRFPLFKKRSGSDRGSRDIAQPCRVAIGRIPIVCLGQEIGPLDRRVGLAFLRRSGKLSTTFPLPPMLPSGRRI
jgi:hypothetical protein